MAPKRSAQKMAADEEKSMAALARKIISEDLGFADEGGGK